MSAADRDRLHRTNPPAHIAARAFLHIDHMPLIRRDRNRVGRTGLRALGAADAGRLHLIADQLPAFARRTAPLQMRLVFLAEIAQRGQHRVGRGLAQAAQAAALGQSGQLRQQLQVAPLAAAGTQAVECLYSLSYTVKFALKKTGVLDYGVLPLEGLWWCDAMETFSAEHKEEWKWRVMIMQPDVVTDEAAASAREDVRKKKNLPLLDEVRFELYAEGASAQIMHVGPYATEAPTITALHEFIGSQGRTRRGLHHEIYLGDPRKSAPEKLKTILRQPIQ